MLLEIRYHVVNEDLPTHLKNSDHEDRQKNFRILYAEGNRSMQVSNQQSKHENEDKTIEI